ncbi:hypothetical protein SAMN02799624_06156 [Paenibacillus sp. UNC496MF]|nr:hypothetical protein SAMN02799624_06156 [Paenibacillus sp. UNC496MF]
MCSKNFMLDIIVIHSQLYKKLKIILKSKGTESKAIEEKFI